MDILFGILLYYIFFVQCLWLDPTSKRRFIKYTLLLLLLLLLLMSSSGRIVCLFWSMKQPSEAFDVGIQTRNPEFCGALHSEFHHRNVSVIVNSRSVNSLRQRYLLIY